jgi:hypothetical protein
MSKLEKKEPKKKSIQVIELSKISELKQLFFEFANIMCETIDSYEGVDDEMMELKWNEFLAGRKFWVHIH